jgi:hypothetical protein
MINAMAESAEKFYTLLGFKPFGEDFWKNSVFKENPNVYCDETVNDFKTDGEPQLKIRYICFYKRQSFHLLITNSPTSHAPNS